VSLFVRLSASERKHVSCVCFSWIRFTSRLILLLHHLVSLFQYVPLRTCSEFDGGDGQMGVAGDGKAKLDKFDMTQMAKSKTMSAKNAWGKSTGYADTLIDQGVEAQRAQQLENWKNQQEVLAARKQQKWASDEFDKISTEEDQWSLSKFGVERNQVSHRASGERHDSC
jgi:hypothetical protein